MRNYFSRFQYFDIYLFSSSILLLLLGLLMIYSTTLESSTNLSFRQGLFAVLSLVFLFLAAFYDYRSLQKATPFLYVIIILLLAGVLFFGTEIRGSTRWFNLGFFTIQPAEFAKIILVIVMAKFLSRQGEKLKDFRYVLLSALYILLPAGLILIEPDLGSALVVLATWFGMLIFSAMNKKHILILIAAFLVLALFSWQFLLHDYQKTRVETFLNPSKDPQGQGYNVLQSIIAVGSGHLLGRGVGRGLQSQLKFLPERQTDFIFASTAEELGLIGSSVIIILYFVIFFRLIKTVQRARDNFGMYLALGIFFMLFVQVVINIGMNLGLLPVTGIPLPLVSYGGSSLVVTLISLGLIQSIVAKQKAVRF